MIDYNWLDNDINEIQHYFFSFLNLFEILHIIIL